MPLISYLLKSDFQSRCVNSKTMSIYLKENYLKMSKETVRFNAVKLKKKLDNSILVIFLMTSKLHSFYPKNAFKCVGKGKKWQAGFFLRNMGYTS